MRKHTGVVEQFGMRRTAVFRDIAQVLEEKPQRLPLRDREPGMSFHDSPFQVIGAGTGIL